MVELSTNICGLRLPTPLLVASGTFAVTPSLAARAARRKSVGAVVTKSITKEPREGFGTPVLVAVGNVGFINAMGLPNPGASAIREFVKAVHGAGKPIVVSVAGSSPEEFAEVAQEAEEAGADAVELNLSCPHTKGYGVEIASDPRDVYTVVREVAGSVSRVRILAKLGASDNVVRSAEKAVEAGACGLTLINTIRAMYVDVWSGLPVLSNVYGGLSGPAIHPVALRVVFEVRRRLPDVDIIGVGGVVDWESAVRFFMVGATAVQVGSAIAVSGLKVFDRVLRGIERFLRARGYTSVRELVGLTHRLVNDA